MQKSDRGAVDRMTHAARPLFSRANSLDEPSSDIGPSTHRLFSRPRLRRNVQSLTSLQPSRLSLASSITSSEPSGEEHGFNTLHVEPHSPVTPHTSQTHSTQQPCKRYADQTLKLREGVADDPDFIIEERAAWSADPSQTARIDLANGYGQTRHQDSNNSFWTSNHVIAEQSRQRQFQGSLRDFEPLPFEVDVNDRPKTSRGSLSRQNSGQFGQSMESFGSNAEPIRKSVFIEGSMSANSRATASTWAEQPVDSRPNLSPNRRNDLFESQDYQDFKPLPPTPSTLKGSIFRLSRRVMPTNLKSTEQALMSEGTRQNRKGLKKGVSIWNLNTIGEKMKIFGGSTHDFETLPNAGSNQQQLDKSAPDDMKNLLDERKRKAEIAYATQFGFKKQKDNSGLVVEEGVQRAGTVRKRVASGSSGRRPMARLASNSRPRLRGLGVSSIDLPPILVNDAPTSNPDHVLNPSSDDEQHRKRPSRAELEAENQNLRRMLRDSEARINTVAVPNLPSFSIPSTFSSIHLPLHEASSLSEQKITQSSIPSYSHSKTPEPSNISESKTDSTNKPRTASADMRTLPSIPARTVLGQLTNTNSKPKPSEPTEKVKSPNKRPKKISSKSRLPEYRFPRPVSMILEVDENHNENDVPKENISTIKECTLLPSAEEPRGDPVKRQDQWVWDDDIF